MPSHSAGAAASRQTAANRAPAARLPGLLALARTEARLLLREVPVVVFGLCFPAILILALGLVMPGFTDPNPNLGGRRTIEVYVPVVLGLALCSVAFSTLPGVLATYRQTGVMRRLGTTPLPRSRMLVVQLALQTALSIVAAMLALALAVPTFALEFDADLLALVAAFVLSCAALFAIGLVVASLVRTTGAANAVGMAFYFPMLFFAGVWIPRDSMPDTMRAVSDLMPTGAAVHALQDAWFGAWPGLAQLAVLAVWGVVAGILAARLFRWD